MKSVSSENLARFKAKCDETYAAIDNVPTVSTELVNLGTLSTSGTLTTDQVAQIGTTTVGVTARASVNSVTRFYERVNISGTTATLVSVDDDALHVLTVNLSTRAYTLSDVALGGSGTNVVANPTTTGTEDLTSLQVGETVYNIPQSSGGITNAEVIEYAEQLPEASETSPNFVQTPDGTLYRKKAVGSDSLLGTWVFNDTLTLSDRNTFNVSFTSNGNSYTEMSYITGVADDLSYGNEVVYSAVRGTGGWNNTAFKTINITDISSLTNVDEFTSLISSNATQTGGGGASISYEYVAMQEVPTPTTADNGKVLGVTNGAYALQESSGGGGIIGHTITIYGDDRIKNFNVLKSDLTVATLGNLSTRTPPYDVTDVIAISFYTLLSDLISIDTQAEQFVNIVEGANSNLVFRVYTLNKDTDFKVSEIDSGGGGSAGDM